VRIYKPTVITFQVSGDGRTKESHPAVCHESLPQVHGPDFSALETERLAARIDELSGRLVPPVDLLDKNPKLLPETRRLGAAAELAVLTELKNGLRAGDVWVPGSRQFKDFEEYLVGRERVAELRDAQALPVAIDVDSERYLQGRLALLTRSISSPARVNCRMQKLRVSSSK
jgi:hypothetical protein